MTSEPDLSAKSAVTVPMPVTPKPVEPAPDGPAEPLAAAPESSTPEPSSAEPSPSLAEPSPAQPDEAASDPKPPVVGPEPAAAETQPLAVQREPSPSTSSPVPEPAAPVDEPGPSRPPRSRAGGIGVALVLVAAGLLFTTSATTARGTQLRSERANLADLIAAQDIRVEARTQRVAALNKQVQQEAAAKTVNSKAIETMEERAASVITAAGLRPMTGPGLTVTLDDAPRDVPVPAQAGPDDLVVHQQDVQAVVNALWAGGAEAMMLQDQRVISTSAVRCVGNTLILQGRVYSPPYTISVIGDVKKMRASLDSSPQIAYYLQYVASLRLGWSVKRSDRLELPAYAGSLALTHARVAGSTSPSSSSGSASSSP